MDTHQEIIFINRSRTKIMRPLNINWTALKQALRFVIVGIANTAVDFAVLNALILAFGLTSEDPRFIIFKTLAFIVAAINSFILNKHWVFEEHSLTTGRRLRMQIYKFFSVSAVSMIINITISFAVFTLIHRIQPEPSTQVIANLAALVGTGAVFISNFFGYKLFVFKK